MEVVADDGLHDFSASGVIVVRMICANEVHEDDACRTCRMVGEIVKDGFVGMRGVVTIAITEGDFASEERLHFGVGRSEVEDPDELVGIGRIHPGAAVQHLGEGIDFEGDTIGEMGGREILHIEFAPHTTSADDGSSRLTLPIDASRPTGEDASDGRVAVMVATEDENLATHLSDFEVRTEIDKEALESVLSEQLLDARVVGILHLVAIGSMEHVDDDKL